jgi:hypothetical protein
MTGTGRMVEFSFELPDGWWMVPATVTDVGRWSSQEAERLLAESGRAVPAGHDGSDVTTLLAGALAAVVGSVQAASMPGMRAAVLVRRPDLGSVDAMLTLVPQRGVSAETFVAEIEQGVEQGDAYLTAQRVEATVGAGQVHGMHLMIAHLEPEAGPGVAHLEERMALGVFPDGSVDMLEVTLIASEASTFDDMPQAAIDLLGGLDVRTEAA